MYAYEFHNFLCLHFSAQQKILKLLIRNEQEQKYLKREVKAIREKLDILLGIGENPAAAAAINDIVTEEFPTVPLTNLENLQNLERSITNEPAKASSLVKL